MRSVPFVCLQHLFSVYCFAFPHSLWHSVPAATLRFWAMRRAASKSSMCSLGFIAARSDATKVRQPERNRNEPGRSEMEGKTHQYTRGKCGHLFRCKPMRSPLLFTPSLPLDHPGFATLGETPNADGRADQFSQPSSIFYYRSLYALRNTGVGDTLIDQHTRAVVGVAVDGMVCLVHTSIVTKPATAVHTS